MGTIVEWQSLKTQEYRYQLLASIAHFWELFGVRRPVRYEKPIAAGEYDTIMEIARTNNSSMLSNYLHSNGGPIQSASPEVLKPTENAKEKSHPGEN